MKQFELHPASESYYRKEGAVNCSRRLSAAILSLVATVVCTFLVLAVSSTTAYAAVATLQTTMTPSSKPWLQRATSW